MRKMKFTLIEVVMTIVVLGLLIALVVPNLSNMKKESYTAQITTNIKVIQTAVDSYYLKNNSQYPTGVQPTLIEPRLIKSELLYPNYLKDKLDKDHYYWVDAYGEVWGSTILAPSDITEENGYIKWSNIDSAIGYQIFEVTKKGEVLSSVRNKFNLKKGINLKSLEDTEIFQHQKEENVSYLISAIDEYGMPTPPTGLSYNAFVDPIVMAPNVSEQTLSLIVGSEEMSEWLSIVKEDYQPEGTSIDYEFSVSNDKTVFSDFSTDFDELQNSKYLKVKITFKRTGTNSPSIYSLKVLYKPEDRIEPIYEPIFIEGMKQEEYFQPLQPVPVTVKDSETNKIPVENTLGTVSSGESTVVPVSNPDLSITIPKNSTSGKVVQIIDLGESKYIDSFTPIIQKPYGANVSQTYQTSKDGVTWSTPTSFPKYSPIGRYVKVTTTYENKTNQPIIIEKPIVVVTDTPPAKNLVLDTKDAPSLTPKPEIAYEELSRFSVVQNAGSIVDWNSITTKEDLPKDTRIRYVFHTSADNINWEMDGTSIDKAKDSRYLKIEVIKEKVKGSTITTEPILYEIFVDYIKSTGAMGSGLPYNETNKLISSFPYTGTQVNQFIIPVTGVYKLEVWGGKGGQAGRYCVNSYGGSCYSGASGQAGQYTAANFLFNEGDILYLYQGNGGGNGGNYTNQTGSAGCHQYGKSGGGGGGAASEVRLNENTKDDILISSRGGNGGNGQGSASGCRYGSAGGGGAGTTFGYGYTASNDKGGSGGGSNILSPTFIEGTKVLTNSPNIGGGIKISRLLGQ